MIRPRSKLFPTDRPYVDPDPMLRPVREVIYLAVKHEPVTAQRVSELSGLSLLDSIDALRVLENFGVVRHRCSGSLDGVVWWHHVPGNAWDQPAPPF